MNDPANALVRAQALDGRELDVLVSEARRRAIPIWDLAAAPPRYSEESIADAFAAANRVPRIRVAAATVERDALAAVPEKLARRCVLLPLTIENRTLVAAIGNPLDLAAINDIEFASSLKLRPVVATRTEILDPIAQHYTPNDQLREFVANVAATDEFRVVCYGSGTQTTDDDQAAARNVESTPVVKLVNLTIYDAIKSRASDIHVEPGLNEVDVRMRVDGALRPYTQFPKWLHDPVVSRLKILARLDIAERRVPQDGRIGVVYDGQAIDLRVSTLPTNFGEKVVLRILGGSAVPPLHEIVLDARQLGILERAVAQPQGMILVTGPTGSGKTTTLYALLARRRAADVNIVTIEDPIEYQLDGVTQVQVNVKAGLTFESTLRSILHQDPDVILVGEIRDLKTTETALQAAMTGHLVLSSLHTNSTVATITRLLDLGADPMVVAGSLSAVVAQRLVRRTCEQCKEVYVPDAVALAALRLTVREQPFVRGRGCPACGETGYAGRTSLIEVLPVTTALKTLIHSRGSETAMRQLFERSGERSFPDAGAALVRAGTTTAEEVVRVIGLSDGDAADTLRCPHCGGSIEAAFSICPFCRQSLKATCAACGQELKPEWQVCPYCQHEQNGGLRQLPPRSIAPPAKQLRILIVDDDPLIRRAVTTALSAIESSPSVAVATNGREALQAIERELPDLVVLDVMMPEMDGFDVCEQLRRNVKTAFVPVLMLTRNSDEEHRTRAFLVGTDDFMSKPFSVPELTARVNRLLRRTYGL